MLSEHAVIKFDNHKNLFYFHLYSSADQATEVKDDCWFLILRSGMILEKTTHNTAAQAANCCCTAAEQKNMQLSTLWLIYVNKICAFCILNRFTCFSIENSHNLLCYGDALTGDCFWKIILFVTVLAIYTHLLILSCSIFQVILNV